MVANYTNGKTIDLAEIPLYSFNADSQLKRLDGGGFQTTQGSGVAIIGATGNIISEALEGSRIRITTPSPKREGSVDTLKSTTLFLPILSLIRPSWGTLLSEISSPDIILILEIKAFLMVRGRFIDLNSEPSTLYLTCKDFS